MAVVVQEMVAAEYAGVIFTHDPVTRDPAVLYAEWVAGTGETLVSGADLHGRAWIDRGGTLRRADHLDDQRPEPPARLWADLERLAGAITDVLGKNQDIEWAWSKGRALILQSRPIVAGLGAPSDGPSPWELPGRPRGGWTDRQRIFFDLWDEYSPRTVSPLDYALFQRSVWQASLDMMDPGAPEIDRCVVISHHVPVAIDPTGGQPIAGTAVEQPRSPADLHSQMRAWADTVSALTKKAGRLREKDDATLLALLRETGRAYADAVCTRLRAMSQWIVGMEEARKSLQELLQTPSEALVALFEAIEMGVEHDRSRMDAAFAELARSARGGTPSRTQRATLDAFLEQFGHLSSDGILLALHPEVIESQLRHATVREPDGRLERSRAEAVIDDARSRLKDGKAREEFERVVRNFRAWVALRENSKARQELSRPLFERLLAELEIRLHATRALPADCSVRLLTPGELESALEGIAPDPSALRSRSVLIAWKTAHSWLPSGFLANTVTTRDRTITGTPGSPGCAEGRARFVLDPTQFATVKPGEIVIARATNPMWTQLFTRIAAIVVEHGSRLSHAAVAAREFGIPAVVGIPGVTAAIADGEWIRVDGTNGEIKREKDVTPHAERT
jgi:pyruvate,water dikinase